MKYFRHLFFLVLALLPAALAAETAEPNVVMATASPTLKLLLAGSVEATTFNIDEGDGTLTQYTLPVDETLEITLSPKGADKPVKIYGVGERLEYLNVEAYELTELTFNDCPNMKWILCSHNNLTTLDITKMPELIALVASYNDLSKVDISKCPKLITLDLKMNANLGNINFSTCPELEYVDISNASKINNIDVSKLPNLTHLGCEGTSLSRIDVTKNPELTYLNCSYVKYLYQIDLTKNPKLEELYISTKNATGYSRLNQLDVTNCPELTKLFCSEQNLTTLDVSKNTKLTSLFASGCELTSIDITNCPGIIEMSLFSNRIPFNMMPAPIDNPQIGLYYYTPMKSIALDDIEYGVDGTIDLAEKTYSEKHATHYSLFLTDSNDPAVATELTEGTDFSVDKGVIKLLKAQSDSCYISMTNDGFPSATLKTTKFMVRNADELGQNSLAFEFTTSKEAGSTLSFTMAAYTSKSKVFVDWGDGEMQENTIESYINHWGKPISGTVPEGGKVKVYTSKGVQIKDLNLPSLQISSIDLSKSHALQTVDLSGNELTEIDFSPNRRLQTVTIDRNKLKDLTFANHLELQNVYASQNELETISLGNSGALKELKFSNNKVKELDVTGFDRLEILEANSNALESVNLKKCSAMNDLRLRANNLTSLNLTPCQNLNILWLEDNRFLFSTMPQNTSKSFSYGSQQRMTVPEGCFMMDLSSEYKIGDNTTVYTVKTTAGQPLYEDEDYTNENGVITFTNTDYDKVYCEMTNASWPRLTLKTTEMKLLGQPDMVMATMKVKDPAGTAVNLSLATTKDDYVFIDFGDGKLQYANLHHDYTYVNGKVGDSREIKFYTYKELPAAMRVFSQQGMALSEIDLTNMPDLECLNLSGAWLKNVDLSKNTKLTELSLSKNRLENLDLSNHKALWMLNLSQSGLKDVDLSNQTELTWLSLSGLGLEKIDLSKAPKLTWLSATDNKLTTADLSAQTSLRELYLANNLLENIDLSNQPDMAVLNIAGNRFKFSTFPYHTINLLYYGNQAEVEVAAENGVVDLSSEETVNGVNTVYKWFAADGTELTEGSDFKVEKGVTTFLTAPEGNVYCEMTNEFFPELIIKTVEMPIEFASLDSIALDADARVNVYNLSGIRVATLTGSSSADLAPGFYIVETLTAGNRTVSKVHVK